jgi:hypothetical protein
MDCIGTPMPLPAIVGAGSMQKPGTVFRPGLDTDLKDIPLCSEGYPFMPEWRFDVYRSKVAKRSLLDSSLPRVKPAQPGGGPNDKRWRYTVGPAGIPALASICRRQFSSDHQGE